MRLGNVFRVMLIALFVGFVAQAASAQNRWIFLGDKHVDGHDDHDKISISSKEGTFRQLQIRVKLAPVVFQRVVVHFGNGADEELQFRERINAGGSTRALDLRGTDRVIKSVEFWYEKAHWGERRPTVELYGR
ncbi:MAG TPA: hypothetical protein VHP99_05395 [Pyrinomonadaceae bacterium]|nr:hypothetical protein [Pyrinomonadaceae bacterium]